MLVGLEPYEIRFYIVTGLARAGTADNHDIEVSVMFEVELRFFQGKTIIFREEKIVGRIRLILEGDSFFKGAPFRRSGFLSIAIVKILPLRILYGRGNVAIFRSPMFSDRLSCLDR